VLVRSILLRGFDQDMAERIQKYMDELGTEFIRPGTVKEIKKLENGKLSDTFKDSKTGEDLFNGNARVFDTVLAAIGRDIECEILNCENAGVKLNKWGKVITNESDQSNVPHIFSIGDCAQDRPELTPVAIQAGRFLSKRLFGGAKKLMNYDNVVTAVFTPLEYGAVGLNEVDAQKKFGEDDVDIYHTTFKPLEWNLVELPSEMQTCKNDICYVKVVVQISTRKVLGIHFLGPNAGEVIMGYSVALNCGVTYEQLADTVGLHPSVSEEIVDLKITKRENADAKKEGC
jgi:thioredoxin reductase (NADPH)